MRSGRCENTCSWDSWSPSAFWEAVSLSGTIRVGGRRRCTVSLLLPCQPSPFPRYWQSRDPRCSMSLVSLRVSAYVCERLEEAVTVRGGKEVCERTMVEGLSQWVFSVRMIMERERRSERSVGHFSLCSSPVSTCCSYIPSWRFRSRQGVQTIASL